MSHVFELSQIAGINMLFYRGAYVLHLNSGKNWEEIKQHLQEVLDRKSKGLDEYKKFDLAKKMGIKIIISHPLETLKMMINGTLILFMDPGATSYLVLFKRYKSNSGILSILYQNSLKNFIIILWSKYRFVFIINSIFSLYYLFIYLFSIITIISSIISKNIKEGLLVVFVLYYVLISAGPEAFSRFRVPFELILIVLSCLGLEKIFRLHLSKSD